MALCVPVFLGNVLVHLGQGVPQMASSFVTIEYLVHVCIETIDNFLVYLKKLKCFIYLLIINTILQKIGLIYSVFNDDVNLASIGQDIVQDPFC